MKIQTNKSFSFKRSISIVCFFASMFIFAGFTKEDRQKVRSFKLRMMDKYIYHSESNDVNLPEYSKSKNQGHRNPDIIEKTNQDSFPNKILSNTTFYGNENLDNIFASEEKQGIIGEFSEDESDNVSDNFFTIVIPEIKKQNTKAYLVYDLFGLDSYHSVSRSINKNIAFGGDIIVANSKWSLQKEEIALNSLEKGKNTILFTSSLNGVKYKVKNVKIVFENNFKLSDNISSLLSGNNLYIKGVENGSVNIKGKAVSSVKGEYEALLNLTEEDKDKGFVTITTSNGIKEYKFPESKSSFKTLSEERFAPLVINISKDAEYTNTYEGTTISVEKNSVENTAHVQVLKLRKKDYPAISREIKSMTVNSGAYRLENRSGELTKSMIFSFPYDEKKLGARSAKELKAFYFDYTSKKWKVDPTSKVDTEKKVVIVETKGDTDYINGVISVPESSQLEAFAPTSISGLKAADPTAGLQLMEVPTATQKGDANANYPIRVPAGLGGLQPSLSIGYSSGGGNGWMGDGWNINGLSAITVDTRWGTPTFNSDKETELYSLDGEMLVYPNTYLPHRHNDVSESNTAITTEKQLRTAYTDAGNNQVKKFYLRKNHDFTLIERIGTSPSNYTWKVTSTDGTKRYYGGSGDSVLSGVGGVAHWGLRLIEDAHGNTIKFTYYNESAGGGTFFQVKKIEYGKNYDYTVNFNRQVSITRKDISVNAKQGFARVEPYLLNDIEVKYKTELVRTYKMDYIEGEFFKTLLKRIYIVPNNPCTTTLPMNKTIANKERDMDDGTGGNGGTDGGIEPTCNEISDSYTFEYYNDVKDGQGNVRLFGADTYINFQNDKQAYSGIINNLKPSKINGNISSETGINFRPAAGLNFYTPSSDAYGHLMFGFPFGNSSSKARNAQQLVDFNGDGIQDMIYRVPNEGLFLRTGQLDSGGNLSFLGSKFIGNYNGGDFSFTETKTTSSGWDMGAIIYSRSQIGSSSTSTTKTYLTDANSDGLMDIVNNGEVWFNKYDTVSGKSEMTKYSEYTENMVVKAKAIQSHVICPDPKECPIDPEYPPTPIVDVVKVWIAPKDGYIRFIDNIVMASYGTIQNPPQRIFYSVEIQRPAPLGVQNNNGNGRIYLTELHAGDPMQNINIRRYNDYYTSMQSFPVNAAINSSEQLYVRSGDKVYVRLHKNTVQDYPITSDPNITYVDTNGNDIPNTFELSQGSFQLNNGTYGTNMLLNNLIAPIYLDAQGTATINVERVLLGATTDKITFRIVKENAVTGVITNLVPPQVYPQNDFLFFTVPQSLTLDVNPSEPVYLRFIVESDSHTNFLSSWNGKITVDYNAVTTANPNTPNVSVNFSAIPEYPSFAVTQLKSKLDIYSIPNSIFFTSDHNFGIQINKNITNFSNLGTGSFYYIIKKGNQVLGKRKVVVSHTNNILIEKDMDTDADISGILPVNFFTGNPTLATVGTDHLITVEVYCKTGGDYALFNKYTEYFSGNPFNVYYDDTTMYGSTSATAVNTAMYNTKTPFFKNWGQFLYKPGSFYDYTYGNVIENSAFSSAVSTQNTYTACQTITNNNAALAECILNATSNPNLGNNTVSQLVAPMKPQLTKSGRVSLGKWVGAGPNQYSSTSGFQDDDTVSYFSDPVSNVPVPTPATYTSGQLSVDTTMKSINKIYKSSSKNTTNGLSYGMGSGGNSETVLSGDQGSVETQTFSDLNGDGYPDIIYPASVQFTNSTGSLEDVMSYNTGDFPTNSASYQRMNSLGFSYNAFSVTGRIGAQGSNGTSTQSDTGLPWSGGGSVSAGMNDYYDSYDSGKTFWMDINGDGLPDRIKNGGASNMAVALNFGKSLGGYTPVDNLITYRSHPKGSFSIGIGGALGASANLGALSSFGFGISASAGASASKGTAEVVYEDVNGDGLIDILEIDNSNNSTSVRYNLGNKFNTAVPLVKSGGNIDFTDETQSFNGSLSFGGNYMFNIGPITLIPPVVALILWIKAGAGATVNLGINVSETKKAFKDMNGDGFTDVVQDTDSGLVVNYSLIGRTNKLKSITNTFSKGKYLVDYGFSRANYNNPHAKLVVNKISVVEPDVFSANYTTEYGNKMQTNYTFQNRKYDRRERDDFGFGIVVKEEMNSGTVARTSTDYYFTNSYLLSGLIKQSTVQGDGGSLMSDIKYNYKLRKFINDTSEIDLSSDLPLDYDSGGREGRKMGIALLDEKVKTIFETGGSITTTEKFSYTPEGLISKYQYTSPSATYNSNITYQAVANNIIGIPVLVEVYDGTATSTLLRRRRAYNINWNNGNVGTYAVFNGTNESVTDVEYNSVGNVKKVTYPENNSAQRYFVEYTYDDTETGKYVVQVKDVFNIQSTAKYNPLFDVVTRKVDTGGNAMVFYYDGFGRTKSIMGPNEIASGSTVPTIRYRYWLDHAGIPNNDASVKIYRASTSNFDPQYAGINNTIMTDTYSDFLGRIVQVKKDIEFYGAESRSISGRTVYDILGRVIRQHHPTVEGMGNQNLNSNSLSSPFTSSAYDSKDRVITFTDEDGIDTNTTYAIDGDLLKTTTEISNEKSESYTNAEGKIVQKDDYLNTQPLTTAFKYNTIGELVSVRDPEGIETQYFYDLAGRRKSQIHPDKGTTLYEYDLAGNVIRLSTDNLVNDSSISTHHIFYKYDYNRLTGIVLPDLPSGDPNPNEVYYEYGLSTAGNNAGRIVSKYDGSGTTSYAYGRMGEVLSEERTVVGHNIPTMYFKTYFNYDSWNRITKIKYPDDEIVSYHYDLGGNLKSVNNNFGETYIQKIDYDGYEQRTMIKYGNGTSQKYTYNIQNRKLLFYNLINSSNQPMLNNIYGYDEFSNVTTIKNDAYPLSNGMGGVFHMDFTYDTLNRLGGTSTRDTVYLEDMGTQPVNPAYMAPTKNNIEMEYNNAGGIIRKKQHHERDLTVIPENTYQNKYKYVDGTHKVEKVMDSFTGNEESFVYDYNGNAVKHNDSNGTRSMFWDEQDRLRAFYNDNTGIYQYYTYDDKGERVIKYGLEAPAQLYQNGAPVQIDDLKMLEYKIYPNPYVTVSSSGQYTKHYFEGSKRFASRVLDNAAMFEDPSILNKSAASKTEEKTPDTKSDFRAYLEKAGLGNDISIEFREMWQRPDLYYLHGDHLGTATFVTNSFGDATQFFLNLPFGETMLEQMDGSYNNPYKFNAKELDEDTGLYYYGARYYNPRLSIWYGVDPLAEKMPSWSPYAFSFDNPIRYVDPDGREATDWYRNKKTNNIEWKDTNKEVKGYEHLGKSNTIGASADGIDRMYYLHANGSATVKTGDAKTTIFHAEGGESLSMISGGTITTSQTSVSGLSVQGGITFAPLIAPGFTLSAGYVKDSYGDGKFYYSYGKAIGLNIGVGFDFTPIKTTDNERLFKVADFEGYGNAYSGGIGASVSYGGTTDTNTTFMQNINPNAWGKNKNGYTTNGVGYGIGLDAGAAWTRTNTKFFTPYNKKK